MRNCKLVITCLLASAASARPVDAQGAASRRSMMPDSAQMGMLMARALRQLQPAQFVLDHRAELSLTPEQVPFLESLVLAQVDSGRVRNARRLATALAVARNPVAVRAGGAMTWTGAIDETAIREMSRAQAEQSAEIQIDMAHDRHAVGAVLTPSQVSMLSRIEAFDMMSAVGRSQAVVRSTAGSSGSPYFEYQVDKQVAQAPGSAGPKYPDALRASNTEGEVIAQFVVDSAGHYEEGSFQALKSSHELFTQALRDALPQMRFIPAEVGGTKVRQLVQQPFTFTPRMK